ncbi:MAG: TIM barrel protein [Armatimonadota bacterium]
MSTPSVSSGLTSVTFRKLSPGEIISLAVEANLEGIEWGGDVHVPPGDRATAQRIARQTRQAGLKIPSYGSYYRLGVTPKEEGDRVLASASVMGASIVRVWAGNVGSADASPETWTAVIKDAQTLAERAASHGLRIACEWHGGTLTDTLGAATKFLDDVDHPAFGTYWQPRNGQSIESRLSDLKSIAPRLMGLHVFQWGAKGERQALSAGEGVWTPVLNHVTGSRLHPLFAHLEFVPNDDPAQMRADAATLRQWIKNSTK